MTIDEEITSNDRLRMVPHESHPDELLLKIGIQISPRTVRRYMPTAPKQPKMTSQRWMTFVQNHAKAIIACDFFIVATATFQLVCS